MSSFTQDFSDYWNKKYFPIDFINMDNKSLKDEIIETFGKYFDETLTSSKAKKALDNLKIRLENDNFNLIDPNEKTVFANCILKYYKLDNFLNMEEYYYLYLDENIVPCYIDTNKNSLLEILDITDVDDFVDKCFETTLFGNYATKTNIKKYITEHSYDYLDKIITCYEEINKVNILAISNEPFSNQKYGILRGIYNSRVFTLENPVKIIYFKDNNWYDVIYQNLLDNSQKSYNEMGEPNKNRLKILVENLYEKEDVSKLSINYEPTDIGKELPIIKMTIGEKEHEFTVGSTYNLYLKTTGEIVGKVDIISVSDGKGHLNIHWIEGYPSLLN